MIDAQIIIDPPALGLTLRGHAGYNPGNDVVCAGVSAIVFTLLGWIENNRDALARVQKLRYNAGEADILIAGDEQAQAVFEAAAIGLCQIEAAHPRYIKVSLNKKSL